MQYAVLLGDIVETFGLEELYMPEGGEDIPVYRADLNRPGLALAGFTDYFDNKRMLLISRSEMAYLSTMASEVRRERVEAMFVRKPPGVLLARGVVPVPELMELALQHEMPVLRSYRSSTVLTSQVFEYLSVMLAPRELVHGVLMEVYGWGVLMVGQSGIGKSETAVELIKRGHRLVADDAVEIKRLPTGMLQGTAPETIRHFIEIRGIGVLNVRNLFGMSAVKLHENVLLVAQLELWDEHKVYDRLGMEDQYYEILGVKVPSMTVPVRPGRNLSTIIEVAAMNARMKMMGYNSAEELDVRVLRAINHWE
ncbi:MAG: HPr(Ser) kinase/phosphatase [Clostridiales bacterium]|nr:HPr(Ser) kinase/phosphatase [Clostridiales bacterium]